MSNILKEAIQKSTLSDFDSLLSFLESTSQLKEHLTSTGALTPAEGAASTGDFLLPIKLKQMKAVYLALKAPIVKSSQMAARMLTPSM